MCAYYSCVFGFCLCVFLGVLFVCVLVSVFSFVICLVRSFVYGLFRVRFCESLFCCVVVVCVLFVCCLFVV